MKPVLHVGHLPEHLDERVVHVPGRVHPLDLEAWLATLFATRHALMDEPNPYEIACNHPGLADLFEPDCVIVWSRAGKSAPISQCPAWTPLGMPPGQLWMLCGEEWVDV